GKEERAFVDYLSTRFDDAAPDVVVTLGAAAARLYIRHRTDLFPDAPLIMGALDQRFVQQIGPQPSALAVAGKIDLPSLTDNVLHVLAEPETIAVVLGASELERFWLAELRRELAPLAGRVKFEWLNDLALVQMQDRVAALPPHSAVFYGLFAIDAAGVPHE